MKIKTENLEMEKKNPLALFYQFRELGLFFFIVILCIGVQLRNPSFLTGENILDMATNTSILVILALGMMIVLITRGIDLSIGAVIALSGMLTAQLVAANPSVNPFLCLLIGTVIGALCGMVIGVLVAKVGLLPIIATLALMNIFRGLTFLVSDGEWVSSYQMSESFVEIATGTFLGLNHLIWIAVLFCLVFFYFLNYTRTGRQIYAVGSNPQSAAVSGIKQGRILFLVYTIMGGLSGLCGVLWVSKFASAQGDTASGYELTVIAACILGGVSIAGGSGKLAGVLLGAILLGILNNALPLLNVSPFWQNGIQGFIILLAVIVNAVVKRRVERTHLLRRAG
ncbi:rhamnose transport system permease protein [Terribacillus saccharophilus]|uniref:Rhamnose transport system permease protein n=2 Tax=Terribacillus saccharophilus TaxID=361277 RepID=A0AAX2EAZ6_9BACI|nr:ABC transporter permease [Terribacillus goriensis]SEM59265.1 rhamnose transport system permease protein [Terribacillus saccharophilus]